MKFGLKRKIIKKRNREKRIIELPETTKMKRKGRKTQGCPILKMKNIMALMLGDKSIFGILSL